MSTSDYNSLNISAQRKKWIAAWALFSAAIFGFGWYKSYENHRDQRAMARWNEEQNDFARIYQRENDRAIALIRSVWLKADSKSQLERMINDGQPFELRREKGRDVAEWADPIYPFGFRLEFENGVLRGFSSNRGDPANSHDRNRRPNWQAWSGKAEGLRQQIVRFSGWLVDSVGRLVRDAETEAGFRAGTIGDGTCVRHGLVGESIVHNYVARRLQQ